MEKVAAKNKKEAKDEKQKDQKTEELVLKSLEEAATPEDKFQLLLRKHVENERSSRRLRQDMKTQEKQLETVLREKENLQREYNKNILMRDKLQEVCREQQKLIKSVKNESMQKIREEEERRKESQTKFQGSLNEITQSLSKNNEENMKLRDHNIEMTKKLKYLAEQYQTREQQLEKLNEQVQLESQLHQAKLNKVQVEAAMEKEILVKEKQIVLEKLLQSQKLLHDLTEREIALKEQLNLYTSKYDDFQSSLQKSNDIFATYKVELDKMSKNTKKLEKESLEWKRKWEKSNATLIELATEKKERDEHAIRCNKQVEQLQKLLRALQTERTHLYKVIRENNVECPPLPALPPEPEPIITKPIITTTGAAAGGSGVDKDKMEMMSKNCAELKQTLANLQDQMKFLNLKGAEAEANAKQQQQEDAAKKRQKKKQKSKANKTAAAAAAATVAAQATIASSSNSVKESSPVSTSSPNNLDNIEIAANANVVINECAKITEILTTKEVAETAAVVEESETDKLNELLEENSADSQTQAAEAVGPKENETVVDASAVPTTIITAEAATINTNSTDITADNAGAAVSN